MHTQISRILVPTDFSKDAHYALEYAVGLAKDYDAELVIVHVVEEIIVPAFPQAPTYIPMQDLENAAKKELHKLADETKGEGVKARSVLRRGSPAFEIIAAAGDEGCELIVMGTHGHTGVAHLLLGSQAERVVRASAVPVLTVRHPERLHDEA